MPADAQWVFSAMPGERAELRHARWELETQPWGAHLLRASVRGGGRVLDIFYLSPLSNGASTPVRGGVPVLFPQFNELGTLPKHGLARTARWIESAPHVADADRDAHRSFRLHLGPDRRAGWPHTADLCFSVRGSANRLELSLDVRNSGSSSFDWTGGLHPYFAVDDICGCSLEGLQGAPFVARGEVGPVAQAERCVEWSGALVERLYHCARTVSLYTPSHRLQLSMSGFNEWMVWNPGRALAASLSDLPTEHWQRFVCVEPVCVSQPVRLRPGDRFSGSLSLTVEGLV